MAANGISRLQYKKDRQTAKLALATADRTASGRRATLDITQLPTVYATNDNLTQDVVNNANSGGLVVGRPWISGPAYTAGLYRTTYSNYNTNSADPSIFANSANKGAGTVVSTIDVLSSPTNTGYEFIGYFKADYTGTWTFSTNGTNVDDAYSVWIGPNAVSGNTTGNALFSISLTSGSGTISMTSGTYYPIRIQFGNNAGPGSAVLYYSHTGQGATNTWTGKIFYNSATNGF